MEPDVFLRRAIETNNALKHRIMRLQKNQAMYIIASDAIETETDTLRALDFETKASRGFQEKEIIWQRMGFDPAFQGLDNF